MLVEEDVVEVEDELEDKLEERVEELEEPNEEEDGGVDEVDEVAAVDAGWAD